MAGTGGGWYQSSVEDWDTGALQMLNGQLERYGNMLPGGADFTFCELQNMATQQRHQIEKQQQCLLAKEQRLKFLKQQEMRHQQIAAENERLRKLREKVEAQELKLKKLRVLRGQVDQQKLTNGNINAELESIRSLFIEKEKELEVAVAKVEQLTWQLEQIKKDKFNGLSQELGQSSAILELEKLRKELTIRNKLNEQQNAKKKSKKEILMKKQAEMTQLDKQFQELQQRLKKKFHQTNGGPNKAVKMSSWINSSNVAAVEPYVHSPKDMANDDLHSNFAKQDPRYQTFPQKMQFADGDNSKSKQKPVKSDPKTDSKYEEYKIPLVVSVDVPSTKPSVNGSNMAQNKLNNGAASSELGRSKDRVQMLSGHQMPPVEVSRSHPTQDKITMGIANFVPKPFGSTHSTSVLSSRDNIVLPQASVVKVPEELRQEGSGQSSPATSEGSVSNNMPAHKKTLPQHGGLDRVPSPLTPDDSSVRLKPMPKLSQREEPAEKTHFKFPPAKQILPETPSIVGIGNATSHSGSYKSNSPTSTKETTFGYQQKGERQNNTKMPSDGASPKLINNGQMKTYLSNSSAKADSVDGNIHAGKLSGNAFEIFHQNSSLLYNSGSSSTRAGEHLAKGSLFNQGTFVGTRMDSGNSFNTTEKHKISISAKPVPFPSGYHHHHRDITADKGSFKANTPKYIRRRHSDSDNEELHKALSAAAVVDKKKPVSISAGALSSASYAEKTIALSGQSSQIPNTVLIDNMGNMLEVRENASRDQAAADRTGSVGKPPIKHAKTILKGSQSGKKSHNVSFDPLALLLDASLEGELDLVKKTVKEVANVSESNDEGITALHNAICAGHKDIVQFLVEYGSEVNAPDSDGWTPLHCAASCNNLSMVRILVNHGACIFATTISDHETPAQKCEEEEDGYDGCSEYLYSIQKNFGTINMNSGFVFGVFNYSSQNPDELSFKNGDKILILRKGDDSETEWWWARLKDQEGYVPQNLLALHPRIS